MPNKDRPGDNLSPNVWSLDDNKRSKRHSARLVAVTSGWTIHFPCMPEQLDFARQASFNILNTPVSPDGFPVYTKTEPMKVPISFKLHAFDSEYCFNGPLTLLDMAAKVHSLVLPRFNTVGFTTTIQSPDGNRARATEGVYSSVAVTQEEVKEDKEKGIKAQAAITAQYSPPEPIILDLIGTGTNHPGVNFQGYVESVKVSLIGPWLEWDNDMYNLPSAAQFDLTIVHNPGYLSGLTLHMPSSVIASRFYNTQTDNKGNLAQHRGSHS